jgi:hypothetical protein
VFFLESGAGSLHKVERVITLFVSYQSIKSLDMKLKIILHNMIIHHYCVHIWNQQMGKLLDAGFIVQYHCLAMHLPLTT